MSSETKQARRAELRQMLMTRRTEMVNDLHDKMRTVRIEGAAQQSLVMDVDEAQDDLVLALIQMKAETLNKINEALAQLDEGRYGLCFECGEAIASARLRALPFAVRCKQCQDEIEIAEQRARALARRPSSTLGFDLPQSH